MEQLGDARNASPSIVQDVVKKRSSLRFSQGSDTLEQKLLDQLVDYNMVNL